MKKLLLFISLAMISLTSLYSQSVQIVKIATEKYPEIWMEFKVKDANGEEIRSFNLSDFEIDENCPDKMPFFVNCPPPGQSKVSYIFTLDRSPSMFEVVPGTGGKTKGDQVKEAFAEMLKNLPNPNRWEAAVVSFAGLAYVMQDFTNDKTLLQDAVDETYKTSRAQTDFNAGFLYDVNDKPGALYLAKNAIYKPVVIFMTDGEHNYQRSVTPSRTNVWEGQIIAEANSLVISTGEQIPATIFCLTLGFPMPNYLTNIANSTPEGEAIEAELNSEDISRIIVGIINKAGSLGPPAPCIVAWNSCCAGGDLTFTYKPFAVTADTTYDVPDTLKPLLEVDPVTPYFSNINPGVSDIIKVNVTARNNYVVFDKDIPVVLSNAKFSILSPDLKLFKLPRDSTITLELQYTSSDSDYAETNITFNSTACSGNDWSASAGWLFQRTVYVGSGTIGTPKEIAITSVICNRTGRTVRITDMFPNSGDAADFGIVSPKPPYDLPSDSCLTITFSFNPSSEGRKSTILVTETNEGTLESELWGDGSGFPEIAVAPSDEISYPNTNCRVQWQDTTITISNIGALALDIQSINLSNSTDFESISWPSIPFTLAPNASQDLVVRFAPKSIGLKTSVMAIQSNSKNNSTYNVTLTGVRDSIGFTVSSNSFDYGELCINETGTKSLTLTNTGTVQITITAADDGNYSVVPNSWTLDPGTTQNVDIVFTSTTENTFNGTIIFRDNFCDFSKSVSLTAIVSNPSITSVPISITSTVGSFAEGTSTITNNSGRDLTITSYDIPCDEMTIISPALPWSIPAGNSLDVTIRYTPINDNFINCFIALNGEPCDFLDSIEVNGNPDQATATIQIEKHTGYAGFDISIPIYLRDMNKVPESGATAIDTRILYDQNLLGNPRISNGTTSEQTGYVDITGMSLSAMTGDVLAVLTFFVGGSTPPSTILEFQNTVSVGGGVNFTEIDGEFTLLISSATLEMGTAEGRTGETVEIPIRLLGAQNIESIHENILTTLSYNYSILQPVGDTPLGKIDNDMRVIELTLPTQPGTDNVLDNLKFRVMLGTADNIPLVITNTRTAKGTVNFIEESGKFMVTNICLTGNPDNPDARLFDPKGIAQIISISPNPASGQTSITFEAQEEGEHNISIYSSIGVQVAEIINRNLRPGVYEFMFDTRDISSGSYFIIYRTPTKLLTHPLGILK